MGLQNLIKNIMEELTSSVAANATGPEVAGYDPIVRSNRKLVMFRRKIDPRKIDANGKSGPVKLPWNTLRNNLDNNNKRVDPITKMKRADPTYTNRKLIAQQGERGIKKLKPEGR